MSYINIFGGSAQQAAFPQYENFTLTANIELSWPTQFQDGNLIVAGHNDVSSTLAGPLSIKMPDARDASVGQTAIFNNYGANPFVVVNQADTVIIAILPGEAWLVLLIDNTTQNGTWRTFPYTAGGSAVTQINATSSSNNLVIGGVPITSSGTITFALANDLLQLSTFGAGTGIATRIAANSWALRQIAGTVNQITVTNPAGIAGNPTLALAANITGITSITVGNIAIGVIDANTISSTNLNGNIILSPNGTGAVFSENDIYMRATSGIRFYNATNNNYIGFRGGNTTSNIDLVWPTTAPTDGQVLTYVNAATSLGWSTVPTSGGGATTPNDMTKFTNATGTIGSTGIICDASQNMTGVGSIQFKSGGTAIISTAGLNANVIVSPNGTGELQSTNSINIQNSNGLKFYNGNPNYTEIRNGTLASNQLLILPNAAPIAGQILAYSGANQLTWANAPVVGGATTVNAIAKYSNTTGGLQDSGVLIDGLNNITGATSATIGNIGIGVLGNTTISNAIGGLIITAANPVVFGIHLTMASSGSPELRFTNAGAFYTGFRRSATAVANQIWDMMAADGAANTMIQTSGAGVLSFTTLTSTIASKAIMETGTSTTNPVIPGNFQHHTAAAKAWGKVSAAGALTNSYNVTSITHVGGSGLYTVNFTTNFANVNYVAITSLDDGTHGFIRANNEAVGSFDVNTATIMGIAAERGFFFVCFGLQ